MSRRIFNVDLGQGQSTLRSLVSLWVVCSWLVGCAAVFPPYVEMASLDLTRGSVGFFTLRLDIQHMPNYEPPPAWAVLVDVDPWHLGGRSLFKVSEPYDSTNLTTDYLVSFQVPAGDYKISYVSFRHVGVLTQEYMDLPLEARIHMPPGQVVYARTSEVWTAGVRADLEADLSDCSRGRDP
jgi:hypothetical protein